MKNQILITFETSKQFEEFITDAIKSHPAVLEVTVLSPTTTHVLPVLHEPWKDMSKTVLERTRLWIESKKPVFEPSRWYDRVNATRTEFQEACNQLAEEGLLVIVTKDQCSEHGHDLDNGYCWECDASAAFDEFGDPQVTEVHTVTYYYHKDKVK